MRRTSSRAILALLLGLALTAVGLTPSLSPALDLAPDSALAADATVNTCDELTFDAALDAVQNSGGGTLTFTCSGTITFTSYKEITSHVTLNGNGEVVFEGNDSSSFFEVNSRGDLHLNALTLQNGTNSFGGGAIANFNGAVTVTASTFIGNSADIAGAIQNREGDVTVIASTFIGNSAELGGAIYNTGTLGITASAFTSNSATSILLGGGAIYSGGGATMTIKDSTFSENTAVDEGGAIQSEGSLALTASTITGNTAGEGGGILNRGRLTITAATISGNTAGEGGGISNPGTPNNIDMLTITASIIANNSAPSGPNCVGAVISGGSNLSNNSDCGFTDPSDIEDSAAINLGPLANNSGPTLTMRPATSSDAIGNADCAVTTASDQRGVDRPASSCDIGALERGIVPLQVIDSPAASGPEGSVLPVHAVASGPPGIILTFDCDNDGNYETPGSASIPVGAATAVFSTASCSFADDAGALGVQICAGNDCVTGTTSVNITNVAPAVNVPAVNPTPSNEGDSVTASASFADPGTFDTHTCTVNYGDGSDAQDGVVDQDADTCTGPDHIYADNGDYTVTVSVTDDDGGEGSNSVSHIVNNLAPAITNVTSDSPIDEGGTTTITVTATDPGGAPSGPDILTYSFDCDNSGDYETTGTGNQGQCSFVDDGSYPVGVQVSDGDDGTDADSIVITVNNVAPTVNTPVVSPTPSDEGDSVTASANFSDPGSDDTHTCTVDYGDGSDPQDGTVDQDADTCTGPAHTYAADGNYTVTVSVSDADQGSGSNTASHDVNNRNPLVSPPSVDPSPSNEGTSVVASASFSDPGTADEHTCTVDYGDGSDPQDGTVDQDADTCTGPDHTYADNGNYTVTVNISDADEGSGSNTVSHTVNNVAPTISEVGNNGPVDEGGTATITVTASDPAGVNDSLSYRFDCDDDGDYETAGSGNQGQCSFTDEGAYTVGVQVNDGDDGTDTDSTVITVNNVAPTVNTPVISPAPSNEGQSVVASVTFSDPGTRDAHTCTVDYGDGSGVQTATVDQDANTCTGPAHTYADDNPTGTPSDVYSVTLTVTDDAPADTPMSASHTVHNIAPTIDAITTNAPVPQGQPVTITVDASDAGVLDVLSYAFDCDNSGDYETAGVGNQGSCALPAGAASSTIGVLVGDDDLGEVTGSVTIGQTLALCASRYTGALSGMPASGACAGAGMVALTLPAAGPVTLCINRYTGAIIWPPHGTCGPGYRVHVVPDNGPLYYCQSAFTGGLRYTASGQCGPYERPGVIPG